MIFFIVHLLLKVKRPLSAWTAGWVEAVFCETNQL
jgi:hypothetical protein